MSELYHYGVPGMRKGVRRFQNEDGTLTALGRSRYDAHGHRGNTSHVNTNPSMRRVGAKPQAFGNATSAVSGVASNVSNSYSNLKSKASKVKDSYGRNYRYNSNNKPKEHRMRYNHYLVNNINAPSMGSGAMSKIKNVGSQANVSFNSQVGSAKAKRALSGATANLPKNTLNGFQQAKARIGYNVAKNAVSPSFKNTNKKSNPVNTSSTRNSSVSKSSNFNEEKMKHKKNKR